MLASSDLVAILPDLPVQALSGVLYRAVNYAALHGLHAGGPYQPDPLYCDGAPLRGARFTYKGRNALDLLCRGSSHCGS